MLKRLFFDIVETSLDWIVLCVSSVLIEILILYFI